jgi:hypothetical protein
VNTTTNTQVRNDQRLGIHLVIGRGPKQQAKLIGVDVRGRQRSFIQVLPSSTEIIVLSGHAYLGLPSRSYQESQ